MVVWQASKHTVSQYHKVCIKIIRCGTKEKLRMQMNFYRLAAAAAEELFNGGFSGSFVMCCAAFVT